MPRPGGESDKLGNQYEAIWTVEAVIDVVVGTFKSITCEAFGNDSMGVEFHLTNHDDSSQFHSVKRQKQGGDWSIADLCRRDKSTGRSILGDLFEKCRKCPNARICFISSTGANELRELSERADVPTNVQEFRTALSSSAKLQSEFIKHIIPMFDDYQEFAFKALKALEVIPRGHRDLTRTVDRRIDELFYSTDGSNLKPGDVRRMLAEYILNNLGRRIDHDDLTQVLMENQIGLRDWKSDKSINETVKAINNRYLSVAENELINSAQISREATQQIIDTLTDDASRGALLVAPGGFGKSCVLAQCLSHLSKNSTPYLCLRMDSLELCNTSRQLGKQLDLPTSPAVVLAGIANNAPSVLVVDQLDAMSLVSGRNPRMWEVFSELCDEVQSYPHMKMILACRDFDLKHDHRLRSLGDAQSGYTKCTLDKLCKADILASLDLAGYGQLNPDAKQIEILAVPFHLLLFLEGDPTRSFASVGELYDRYWERKRQNVRRYLGRDPYWNQVIDALTQKMSQQQVLFAPKIVTDDWEDDAKAMVSEHVLVEIQEQHQYRFFHESFFDYAYARRFCISGRGVVDFLESTEQHLFRRAQVRQILAYRRENEFDLYISDLYEILKSPKVRFHIKQMVASELKRIEKPTQKEWEVIEPHVLDGELSRYISQALRDHEGWFDLLNLLQVFNNWLESDNAQLINAAIWFLESHGLHDYRSAQIAELISPYVDREDNNWRERILRVMSWGKSHLSNEMATIDLRLIASGAYDDYESSVSGGDFWSQYFDAGKNSPTFFIDVLATWFDHAIEQYDDGKSWSFLHNCKQNHSHAGAMMVGEVASNEPEYFIAQMLPRAATTVLNTGDLSKEDALNRMWPYLYNNGDPFYIDEAILLHLRKALQYLAQQDVECFRKYMATIMPYPYQTFGYLLLRSWTDNPKEFADECAKYLIADQRRFYIGYGIYTGDGEGTGESAISRTALRAISPHCSNKLFKQMESLIIGYCDEYEKGTPRWRGSTELLVLRSLDVSRISKQTALRIEELERKFPSLTDAIVEEDNTELMKQVGSPIPPETAKLMTDEQWISAMQKYDGSTDRLKGGPAELSWLLADFARKDRGRFASLADRMPENLSPTYFSAILDGLCGRYTNFNKEEKVADQKVFEETPTATFLKVIDRLHKLPKRPCGSSITNCIGLLSSRQLPKQILEIVMYYATSDPNPDTEMWQQTSGGNYYHGGDPYQHGINCVRGQAAEAISSLLFNDETRFEILLPTLEALSQDPIISVRTCAINAFCPLLNFSRDIAVDLFFKACNGSEAICATRPFNHFIHYAIYSHYEQLRDLLQFALSCENTKAIENAAGAIILAELFEVDTGEDASKVRAGNETMRQAAADVYARHLSHDIVGDKCAEHLREFLSDNAESVQQEVSSAFFHVSGDRLLQLGGFIAQFIESKCFENKPQRLLHALDESNVELPQIICRAAERILEFLGEEGTHIAYHGSMIAHDISTLVVRQYEQTTDSAIKSHCLDLIDQMEKVGYLGIGDELNRIDR
ncbi:hypothetical protein Pan241w_52970 [Gimesia alba]|uniref:ATPase AAA-type core domain-containing protein n=1 Tax=Gimesia alba TaxID=2527973 RepID=A0A517RMS6_9PLAN|nr:hypothetical protein [Gimesia alba]QDT45178.1 hypothetical protein Pan241w_52970 [Gimesia alba]